MRRGLIRCQHPPRHPGAQSHCDECRCQHPPRHPGSQSQEKKPPAWSELPCQHPPRHPGGQRPVVVFVSRVEAACQHQPTLPGSQRALVAGPLRTASYVRLCERPVISGVAESAWTLEAGLSPRDFQPCEHDRYPGGGPRRSRVSEWHTSLSAGRVGNDASGCTAAERGDTCPDWK